MFKGTGYKKLAEGATKLVEDATNKVAEITSTAASSVAKVKADASAFAKSLEETGVRGASLELLMPLILGRVGTRVKEELKPPYIDHVISEQMRDNLDTFIDDGWAGIEKDIVEDIKRGQSPQALAFRELRLHFWPVPKSMSLSALGELGMCRYLETARATILHALYPADGNIWKSLLDPFAVLLLILRLQPFGVTGILIFLIAFFLIDRSDEYQLVNYILKFKAFHFVAGGLGPLAMILYSSVRCLVQEYRDPAASSCLDTAPGQLSGYSYTCWLEPLRIVLIYTAFFTLWCKGAYGGREEIEALESARLDAADGLLDGSVEMDHLRALRGLQKKEGVEDGLHELMNREATIRRVDMQNAIQTHRERLGCKRRTGGRLVHFMIYDAAVLCAVVLWFCVLAASPATRLYAGVDSADQDARARQLLYALLFFADFLYAIAAAPFLIFNVPIVGDKLHGAKYTAYDASGALCPKLTSGLLKAKIAAEERFQQETEKQTVLDREKRQAQLLVQQEKAQKQRSAATNEKEPTPRMALPPSSSPAAPVEPPASQRAMTLEEAMDRWEEASQLPAAAHAGAPTAESLNA